MPVTPSLQQALKVALVRGWDTFLGAVYSYQEYQTPRQAFGLGVVSGSTFWKTVVPLPGIIGCESVTFCVRTATSDSLLQCSSV